MPINDYNDYDYTMILTSKWLQCLWLQHDYIDYDSKITTMIMTEKLLQLLWLQHDYTDYNSKMTTMITTEDHYNDYDYNIERERVRESK